MSTDTQSNTQTTEEAVPFFARFLENQGSEQPGKMDSWGSCPVTMKYPSDDDE
jgi:hypothetical protein